MIATATFAGGYLAARSSALGDPGRAMGTMRVVALLLALGCCAALDDPAVATMAAASIPLRRRQAWRAAVTVVPAAGLWVGAYAITVPHSGASAATAGLVLESATMIAVVLTTALIGQRFGLAEPSTVAGPVAVVMSVVLLAAAPAISPFAAARDPHWQAVHRHWAEVLVALAVLCASATRDPAAQGVRFRRRW